MEQVVLVNEKDEELGWMEKMEAHEKGILHRAFSVFIVNTKGEMLLQQRAFSKYHSGGLWTNACCSHPRPGEATEDAASRRLGEEMGFVTPLEKIFSFIYKTDFDNGLTEHELDHVFWGTYDGDIHINASEVNTYAYYPVHSIQEHLHSNPQQFTVWFQLVFTRVLEWYKKTHD